MGSIRWLYHRLSQSSSYTIEHLPPSLSIDVVGRCVFEALTAGAVIGCRLATATDGTFARSGLPALFIRGFRSCTAYGARFHINARFVGAACGTPTFCLRSRPALSPRFPHHSFYGIAATITSEPCGGRRGGLATRNPETSSRLGA
jgi:hypothetical protein